MKTSLLVLTLLILCACSSAPKVRYSSDWKKDSLKLTRAFANSYGKLFPEYVSYYGFPKFNSKTTSYSRDLDNETYAHAYRWKNRLLKFIQVEKHPELISDAKVLLEFQEMELENIELDRSVGIIPFMPISLSVLNNLEPLIRPDSTKVELNAGMARFRAYVRGEEGKLPLVDGFTSYMLHRMKYLADNRMRGFWPSNDEMTKYIKNSDDSLDELKKLLSRWPGDEWKRDFEEFKLQEANYREFLIRKVLPYSRKVNQLEPRVYAYQLKESGIFKKPQDLIVESLADYEAIYKTFKDSGKKVAQKYNLSDSSPQGVIKFLKARKFRTDKEIIDSYIQENDKLMSIIKEHDLISIKARPEIEIRFATASEMNSIASPHFMPPPMIKNSKVLPKFVIPRLTGEGGTDDYVFREAIINLCAHEAIPGHAVQYQIMKERGVSLARSWLANNSANVEGWAHYAESIVYPYLDEETKFVTIQRRLWRIARAFLDPQLNLRKISQARVKEVFVDELGFSESFAKTEFERYSYNFPGQAPSYYYGYKSLLETKKRFKEKHKTGFTEKCFNDAVLDLGLLPLSEINSRLLKDDLNCGD